MGWSNKRVDQLLDELDIEMKDEKRKDMVHEIVKNYMDDLPVIPLYYRSDIAVIPTKMKNYQLTGHQFPETNQVEKWTLE